MAAAEVEAVVVEMKGMFIFIIKMNLSTQELLFQMVEKEGFEEREVLVFNMVVLILNIVEKMEKMEVMDYLKK